MALPNDVTLNPNGFGGANVNTVFAFITEKDQKSIRRVTATALTAPYTLTIAHQARKQGVLDADSHLIRLDLEKTDTVAGKVAARGWLSLEVPRGQTAIAASDVKDLVGHLVSLWTQTGYADKILAGES